MRLDARCKGASPNARHLRRWAPTRDSGNPRKGGGHEAIAMGGSDIWPQV